MTDSYNLLAIINGMKLLIDRSGRIVVPKRLRERLGFKPKSELEIVERMDGVLLRAVQEKPSLIQFDGLWVHQGTADPGADWESILGDVREERVQSILKA